MIHKWLRFLRSAAEKHPNRLVFTTAFLFVVFSGMLVQFVILPNFLPYAHRGDGLLSGYDSGKYHRIAVAAAAKIEQEGWSAWQLYPEYQIVSGVTSFFYALTVPKPWVLLPVNGLLHGVASVCLYQVLVMLVGRRKLTLLSVTPFMFLPSSLLWHTQIHNENYVIPALMMFVYGWMSMLTSSSEKKLSTIWLPMIAMMIGSLVVWLFRDKVMVIVYLIALGYVLLQYLVKTVTWVRSKSRTKLQLRWEQITLVLTLVIASNPILFQWVDNLDSVRWQADTDFSAAVQNTIDTPDEWNPRVRWERSRWLPLVLDQQLRSIAYTRARFVRSWEYAGSQIDTNRDFHKAWDIITYLPRAVQVGFLAPFPHDWFQSGYKKAAEVTRWAAGVEMIFIYCCLPGLVWCWWNFRRKLAFWGFLFLNTAMILVYTIAIPNVGSLYRFRFPFLLPLVCCGFWGVLYLYHQFRNNKR